MEISLFYFGATGDATAATSDDREDPTFDLLLKGARLADRLGLAAVWTPERHFHGFGGLYSDPAVTSAAIAAVTKRISIRAGSIVLPLHDVIRVAEQWAMVDRLSGGRAGVSIASGWHPRDFVLSSREDGFASRRDDMVKDLRELWTLWAGGSVTRRTGVGEETRVHITPRPIQARLPTWTTTSGNPETFRQAGRLGTGVLTHVLGQDLYSLADNIRLYRAELARSHPRRVGHVALMIHTHLAETYESAMEVASGPLRSYLGASLDLEQSSLKSGTARASADDLDTILDRALRRFLDGNGLIGTQETARATIRQLEKIGVDEVACLIDFGVPDEAAMGTIQLLADLHSKSPVHWE